MVLGYKEFIENNLSQESVSVNYNFYNQRTQPLVYLKSKQEVLNEELWDMSVGDWIHTGVDVLSVVGDFVIPGSGTYIDIAHGLAYFVEMEYTKNERDKPMLLLSGIMTLIFAFPLFNPLQLTFKTISKPFLKIFGKVASTAGEKGVKEAAQALAKQPKILQFVTKLKGGFDSLISFFTKEADSVAKSGAKKPGWFTKFTSYLKKKFGQDLPNWLKNIPQWFSNKTKVIKEALEKLFKASDQAAGKGALSAGKTSVKTIIKNIAKWGLKKIQAALGILKSFFLKSSKEYQERVGKKMLNQLNKAANKSLSEGMTLGGNRLLLSAGKKYGTCIVKGTTKEGTKMFAKLTQKFSSKFDDMLSQGLIRPVGKNGKLLRGAALDSYKKRWVKNMSKSSSIVRVSFSKFSTNLMNGLSRLWGRKIPLISKFLIRGFWLGNEPGSEDAPDEVGADEASGGEVLTAEEATMLEQSLQSDPEVFPDDLIERFNQEQQKEMLGEVDQSVSLSDIEMDESEQQDTYPSTIYRCLWDSFKELGIADEVPEQPNWIVPTKEIVEFQKNNGLEPNGYITRSTIKSLKDKVGNEDLKTFLSEYLLTYEEEEQAQQENDQDNQKDSQNKGQSQTSQGSQSKENNRQETREERREKREERREERRERREEKTQKVAENYSVIIKKFSEFSY